MKRLLIYVHYNPQGLLSSHVLYTLKEIGSLFERVVFISNSIIPEDQKNSLLKWVDTFTERENKGFDFSAWRDAIHTEGWKQIESYDCLTLMNDSCFGPLFNLQPIFEEMDQRDNDYWGITEHTHFKTDTFPFGINIPRHLQSYFMCFKRSVTQSQAFREFWKEIKNQQKRQDVIDKYEIGLSECLIKENLTFEAYIKPELSSEKLNNSAAFLCPDHMIKKKSPFLKVKSFFYFPHADHLKGMIQKETDYNFEFIEEHITQSYNPNKALSILNKNHILPKKALGSAHQDLNVAIHMHAYNPDISKFLSAFKEIETPFDLFVTTDTISKKRQIDELIHSFDLKKSKKEILIHENRGRDVLPWLYLADQLNKYDLVGHFHSKKSQFVPDWVGESWVDEIIDSLVHPADHLFELFKKQPTLGIAIPDVPFFFKINQRLLHADEEQEFITALWNRLDTGKSLEKDDMFSPIMGYGNMFWYRPKALKPLFRYDMLKNEFPDEPIPLKNTLAHQIERLPVYVAWSQNYDFRVILDPDNIFSGFDIENKSGIDTVLEDFKNTPAWKIGRAVTWLPGKIKRFFVQTFMKVS